MEEYLNDPNFEQNRIEYKANKDAADKNLKNGRSVLKKAENCEHVNLNRLNLKYSYSTACVSVIYPGGGGGGDSSQGFYFEGDAKG